MNLGDTEDGTTINEALRGRIILPEGGGAKHFIDGMTSILEGDKKVRAVSLLSGMIAKGQHDLEQKKKR